MTLGVHAIAFACVAAVSAGGAVFRNPGEIGVADLAGEPRDGARHEFDGEQPVGIDRSRHDDLTARYPLEAERSVIGLVADQQDRRRTGLFGRFQRDRDELAADAEILEGGPHGERPEQQGATLAGGDAGQPHGGDDHAAIQRDEGQAALVRTALADACRRRGRSGPARRPLR